MVKIKDSLSSKLLSILLAFSILIGMVSPSIIIASAADNLGTIETLVVGGSVDGNTVTFNSAELNWSPKNDAIGRTVDGWWVGIKMNAPDGLTAEQLKKSKYISDSVEKNFWLKKDSSDSDEKHYIQLWGVVNEGLINDAIVNGKEYLEYNYQFDWDADGEYEQPVKIRINTNNITLKKDDVIVYPVSGSVDKATVEVITGGVTVNGNQSNIIVAEHTSKTELIWHAANDEIHRNSDGWWVGINVIAPIGVDLSMVTYQNKSSSGWGTVKAFDEYKDTDNSIQLWGLVNETYLNNAVANNKNIDYQWRFDWDGDGVYEQLVQLKLDPYKIVLKAKNGEQVYPYLGIVTPLSGGSVSGNTASLELTIDEASLEWSAANTAIGRHSDGWWVGMLVTAPEGYTAEQLNAAYFNRRVTNSTVASGWGEYEKVYFKDVKDSEREVQLWMVLTPALIEKYQKLDKKIATEYVFDWDGDGTDDQTITLIVIPSDKIVLNKVEQTDFAFVEPNPVDKWVGESYTNTASGGQGTGTVTYEITNGADVADIDETTGTLTFKQTGTVTVKATKTADDVYAEAFAYYTVKSIKYPQNVFSFENSNSTITVEYSSGSYTNKAAGGSGDGAITYSISDDKIANIDSKTGTVKFLKAGQVTVTAVKAEDNNYLETLITYILDIKESVQESLNFVQAPTTITYAPDEQNVLTVSGGSGNGKMTYAITSGEEFAKINAVTGAITTLKAGGSFTVEVNKAGDDGYKAATPIEASIYVEYADQSGFMFENSEPDDITYNENNNIFQNKASGGLGTGKVTYALADEGSSKIATINSETGDVTVLAAGTVSVIATKAADDCYKSTTAEYSLTILQDTPEFSVNDVDLIYGVTEYQIDVNTTLAGSGAYTYYIDGINNIGASVDENGKITFTDSTEKVGTIIIKVKKAADDKYIEHEEQFALTVSYLKTSAMPTFTGETKNESGWFTGNITIYPPEGFYISYSNELSSTWAESLEYKTEDTVGDVNVYLKSEDGITDAISLNGLLLDKTAPAELSISYTTKAWEKLLEVVTFGYYNPTEAVVTLSAKDSGSGIAYFTFNYTDEYENGKALASEMAIDTDGTATYSFTVSVDYRDKISFSAVDVSGLETVLEDDKVLVVDLTKPELTVTYNHSGDAREENGIIYTNASTVAVFEITESNFDLSLINDADRPKVILDGNAISVTWINNEETGTWKAECNIVTAGDHIIEFEYTDLSKNETVTYEKEICVDDTAPVISISHTGMPVKYNIYNSDSEATVSISERNFDAGNVILTVTAKDITGEDVDISSKAYADYAKNAANWSSEGDVHTLILPVFDVDAIYSVVLSYTDMAANEAIPYTDDFVVDKTASSNVTIEYSTPISDKVLEFLTFGFYKGEVIVKVTAEDITSGVDYFVITYTQNDGANKSNKATYTTENIVAVQDETNKNVFRATHTVSAEARGTVSVKVADNAGNSSTGENDTIIVADTIAPGLEYEFTFTNDQVREYNNIYYTKGETKIEFTIEEANFDLTLNTASDEEASKVPVVTVNGTTQDVEWTQIEETDKWSGEITLIGNGDYVVSISYADRSTNVMDTFSKEVHIDDVKPEFEVAFDNNVARNDNNYKSDRTATVKLTDHNFKAEEVILTVIAKDITGEDVDISSKAYADYAKNAANWSSEGDVHTLILPVFDIDAIYSIDITYTDLAENEAVPYTDNFVIDKTGSNNVNIEYSTPVAEKILETITFGFYKASVTVTLIAQDDTAGVEYFKLTYEKQDGASDINTDTFTTNELTAIQNQKNKNIFTTEYTLPANARGTISVKLMDKAGNESAASNDTVLVVDDKVPTREVIYTPYKVLDAETMLEVNSYTEGDNSILYYKDEAVVTFKITEANFDLSLKDEATKPVIKVNGTPVNVTWTNDGIVWTATYTIVGDGDYVVTMTYMDLSKNEMVDYQSCKIAIDATKPVIDVKYDNGTPTQTIEGVKYYKTAQTINVAITEHNFRADDVVLTVTAKDMQGNDISIASKRYAEYAKNRDNWTHNRDVHTLNTEGMVFDIDAIYTFDIVYDDIVDNFAEDYAQDDFVVDHIAPENIKIEYSGSIINKIIETVTFGFYKPDVTVTLTADDITSGVDYFDWTYTKESGTSNKNADDHGERITTENITYSNQGVTATATFKVEANARGYISAIATDRTGNADSQTDDKLINIVDNIAPEISVRYEADDTNTKVQFVDSSLTTVDSFEKAVAAYYNGNITANIVVNEANFFEGISAEDGVIHQVGIKLTVTDDNGNVTVTEYLPESADQKYADATPEYITWSTDGDEHFFSIRYVENADYVLEIEYTDLSTNDAGINANDGISSTRSYKSKVVTVDKIAPVVSVEYRNKEIIHTIDNRDYFDKMQIATITVEEHNFRANDFISTVIAKDILGADVNVENFREKLSNIANWTKNGNTYTITITYSVDANYNFDYEYKDLAQNSPTKYDADLFTVDTAAPTNLTISYSTSVLDRILESITFGYYNAEMTVTITAEDDTAGIYYFVYSYIKSEGVSNVNAELINDKIEEANNRIVHDGKKSTTSFTIPKLVLKNDNQFNGTVRFTAYDRSENNTEKIDNRRVIVDNIAPTANITYNKPVQTANNISYYDGNIDAKIVINEANFYSEDVIVRVMRNGTNYPVTVKWTSENVDVHTGTFTLTDDGDYIVTVEYKDRSKNEMSTYKSNRLTLDTKAPTVSVNNIKINSANKDEKYSFTITANDTNLDASSFKPVLTATVRSSDGNYVTKTVSLGEMRTVEAGKTYNFMVDNLDEDAVYSLVCTVKDMSGNEYSRIALGDGNEYDDVNFSINRNGSTFAVDKNTDTLINQYYVYKVYEDVVIEEINVDPVETYVVKLNGKILTEGADYISTLSGGAGEWSKRTYIISKELFTAEGEYNIIIESTDKAETTAYSDVKNLNVSFVVDQTAPVLTISGLEDKGVYQVEEQTVTVIPTDDGGRLYSIKVVVLDSNGNPLKDENGNDISVRFEMSGEEFLTYLAENGGKITFTIPQGIEIQVQIICNDCAVDKDGKTNEYNETFSKVTVSPSGWVIFYAKKPLFYGSIAGVLLVTSAIIFLIVLKKRKKSEKE